MWDRRRAGRVGSTSVVAMGKDGPRRSFAEPGGSAVGWSWYAMGRRREGAMSTGSEAAARRRCSGVCTGVGGGMARALERGPRRAGGGGR